MGYTVVFHVEIDGDIRLCVALRYRHNIQYFVSSAALRSHLSKQLYSIQNNFVSKPGTLRRLKIRVHSKQLKNRNLRPSELWAPLPVIIRTNDASPVLFDFCDRSRKSVVNLNASDFVQPWRSSLLEGSGRLMCWDSLFGMMFGG